jgi:hypothetical protein
MRRDIFAAPTLTLAASARRPAHRHEKKPNRKANAFRAIADFFAV